MLKMGARSAKHRLKKMKSIDEDYNISWYNSDSDELKNTKKITKTKWASFVSPQFNALKGG